MTMLNDIDGNNDNVNDDQWASSSRVMTWLKSASDHQLCERLPQLFGGFITAGYSFIDEARLYSPIFLALQSEMPCRANIGKICRAKRGKFYFNPLESRRQIQERNPSFSINICLKHSLSKKSKYVDVYSFLEWTGGRHNHLLCLNLKAHLENQKSAMKLLDWTPFHLETFEKFIRVCSRLKYWSKCYLYLLENIDLRNSVEKLDGGRLYILGTGPECQGGTTCGRRRLG